jgi:GxxExxY protein
LPVGIAVHNTLGAGLLESIYRECLTIELRAENLKVLTEHPVPIMYRGQTVANALKIDVLVEQRVVVEVKSVERLHPVHQSQVLTYLKLTGCPAGLLMNFNSVSLKAGLKRLVHPDRYIRGRKPRPAPTT